MSSKRALRRKGCEAKVRHMSRALAVEALALLQARRRSAATVRVYACRFCAGFHLGHPRRKKRTRRAEFAK